jgi:hypothetical protein
MSVETKDESRYMLNLIGKCIRIDEPSSYSGKLRIL